MTLRKEKTALNENGRKKGSVLLRSAAASGIIALILSATAVPVLNNYSTPSDTVHSKTVNNSLQKAVEHSSFDTYDASRSRKINYNLPGIPSRYASSHANYSVKTKGGTMTEKALVMNGIVYLPIRAFVKAYVPSASVKYNPSTKTTTVSASGLYISVTHGGYVMYANDRPLFSFSPAVVMSDGTMYVTASSLTKAMGLSFTNSSGTITVNGSYKPLTSASKYYREDEVYWLSKIISAESSGETLLGQIAVGDVIMNRVKSSLYPSTIYSVIFDKKYGVQFSPTADGRIYGNPTYTATLAAKICLEGVSLSDDAMYFLNPRAAQSNWIVNNRAYAYTIGNHDFYK